MSSLAIDEQFREAVDKALDRCDNFFLGQSVLNCRPFVLNDVVIGFVRGNFIPLLGKYNDVFIVRSETDEYPLGYVTLNTDLCTREGRNASIRKVCEQIRDSGEYSPLKAWRNELYMASATYSGEPEFGIERSGAGLIGIKQYGAHVNGYIWVETEHGKEMQMWIARRAKTKPTFPGLLDQIVAGGIGNGLGVRETVIKEAEEEAGMSADIAERAVAAGCISYFYEDAVRGLFPETEYVFDIELPASFTPTIIDGEVSEFFCWPLAEVCRRISLGEFKPNCAIVILDFLVRHGYITADNFSDFDSFVARLRRNTAPSASYRDILARRNISR
ncbi:uncharacterized protein LOC135813686 [Sycon ciliatum]|uniref:uncharacterized protein LOC135813686 n=1 Tax=Sycon ciliatum TaxID=27933 RepID=UPI0020ACFC7B|eukprot:scpid79705/ scgid9102/ Nudix hydrolase 20, chloroplastic